MKKIKKILLLLTALSFQLLVNSQSVPNTTTFSLQNVVDVVNPATDDLAECFFISNEDYWNYYYKDQYYSDYANYNNQLMFRDYGVHNAENHCAPSGLGIFTTNNNATHWIQSPPYLAINDFMLLVVVADNGGTITTPTGWTLITHVITGAHFTYGVYTKVYDGSALGSVTITNAGGGNFGFHVMNWRMPGVSGLTGASGGSNGQNVSTLTGTTNITTGDFGLLIAIVHDNSMATPYPDLSKDYSLPSSHNSSNTLFSILLAGAPLDYKRWKWDWGSLADYVFILPFSVD